MQKRLGKPPCPCTPAYLTYYARVCLLGLGCEYGMGPDLPSATRAAIVRVVQNLKAEHDYRVNKPQCGQHVKVNGRKCKLLAWCNENAVVVCNEGGAGAVDEGGDTEPFVVSKGIVDRTYVRPSSPHTSQSHQVSSLFASAACSGTAGGFLRPRRKWK